MGEPTEETPEEVVGDTTEKWLEWKCVFCKQDLKDSTPKLMPCFHSCCSPCLGTDEDGRGVLKCPSCQQSFNQCDVIDNYFMRELNNESKSEENQAPTCTSCEDNAAATSFCSDCGEWLCDACVLAHQRVRVTKDHVIRAKDEVVAEQGHAGAPGQRIAYCPIHKQEQLKLFCETCDMLTCRDCQLAGHRDHRYQFVSEACKQQKIHLESISACLKEQKAKLTQAKEVSSRIYKELVDKEQTIREEIKQFAMLFISEIGQRSRQLVKELHNICGHKKAELSVNNKGVVDLILKIDHSLGFVTDALEQGSDLALLYSKSILLKQLMALQHRPYSLPPPSSAVDVRFTFEQHNLIGYIRNLGTLLIGDRSSRGPGGGSVLAAHVKNQGSHLQGGLRQGQPPPMNGLSQMLNMQPPPYKASLTMVDSRMNHNSPSPTNPHVTSSSQSSIRQQNTHLWNLLEKPGPPLSGSSANNNNSNNNNPFVKPTGTYVPPSGISSPRPLAPRQQMAYSVGRSALQKMLMNNEPSSSSTSTSAINTSLPRSSVSILPASPNSGGQLSMTGPSAVVPNIIILPMGQPGSSSAHQQHPHQHQHNSIPQYHHPQPQYIPPQQQQQPQMLHAIPVSSASIIPLPHQLPLPNQGSASQPANILLMSGTQRLSHFPQLNSGRGSQPHPQGQPQLRPLAPSPSGQQTTVIVQQSTSGSARPSTPGRPWVSSPHSTISGVESDNSQDRNISFGSKPKPEKVSSSQRPSCGLMGITIKQEKPDDTDDICREMAANVYKELSQDSMDGLFANLRSSDILKEAEAAGSSTHDDSGAKIRRPGKVVQADSSSSPNTVLETSLDNVLSNSSATTPRPSSTGTSESSQQGGSTSSRKVSSATKEIRLDDGNMSDASTEKAASPKDSELVDLTTGDSSESDDPVSPPMPKILETRTLSGSQSEDPNDDWCAVCHDGGDLLCCSKCPKVYHLHCHVPALPPDSQEEDSWQCLMCSDVQKIPDEETASSSGAEDEAEIKKRKFRCEMSGKTLKICERILLELFCHEASPPFHEPVSRVDVPQYYKFIQRPMSFEQIKVKLDPDSYSRYDNLTEFFEDVRLVFENCYTFNEKTSDVCEAARQVEGHLEDLVAKYLPDFVYRSVRNGVAAAASAAAETTGSKPKAAKRRKQASGEDPKNFIY